MLNLSCLLRFIRKMLPEFILFVELPANRSKDLINIYFYLLVYISKLNLIVA